MLAGAPRDPHDDIDVPAVPPYQMFMGLHPFAMKSGIDAERLRMVPDPICDIDPTVWTAIEASLRFDRRIA